MKSPVHLLLLVCIICASSCSKKKETTYNPAGAVIKTISHSQAGTTETFTYNADGKIQSVQNSNGNKTTFAYDSISVTETNYDISGSVLTISNILLDTFGQAVSSVVKDAGGSILGYHTYTFDQGYKTSDNTYTANNDINGRSEWAWGGGNLTEYGIYDSTGTNRIYDTYYWYYDPGISSIGNANKGQKFWGSDSKFLIRKSIRHSYLYGDLIYTFQYSFDDQKRVTEVKTYDHNDVLKNTDSYTYY